MKTFFRTVLFSLLAVTVCRADQETLPSVYVISGGPWYAKCIPSQAPNVADRIDPKTHEWKGKTLVYLAETDGDKLVYTFDWYPDNAYISGHGGGVSIVRLGRWPTGDKASKKDLALSFYRDGKLVASYSTLDLAGSAENVSMSVSHYKVIKKIVGFVSIYKKVGQDTLSNAPDYGFEVVLNDDRHIVFDLQTGRKIALTQDVFTR